jgi:transitional endoplasmic reticulum ATPase
MNNLIEDNLIIRHEGPRFRMFAEDLDPQRLAHVSQAMTGADIKEVFRRAQLAKAMQEARSGTAPPPISQDDIEQCIAEVRHVAASS